MSDSLILQAFQALSIAHHTLDYSHASRTDIRYIEGALVDLEAYIKQNKTEDEAPGDKLKSRMEWKGNYLTVNDMDMGHVYPLYRNEYRAWLYCREDQEPCVRGSNIGDLYSTKKKAEAAAEQAVIDWFERVLK